MYPYILTASTVLFKREGKRAGGKDALEGFFLAVPDHLSFIMAGYNESACADLAIGTVLDTLEKNCSDYELLLVDDASTDGTLSIMRRWAEKNSHVRVIENGINLNYGCSVLRAMTQARGEWLFYDAFDLEMHPQTLFDALRDLPSLPDMVIFERSAYAAVRWRRITSLGHRALLHLFFPRLMRGTPVLNHTQMFRRSVLTTILPIARSPVFFSPEMVFRGKIAGLSWLNRRVEFHSISGVRPGSFGHLNDILWALHDLLRFRFHLWIKRGIRLKEDDKA